MGKKKEQDAGEKIEHLAKSLDEDKHMHASKIKFPKDD